jgi:hypothetical protein
MLDNDVMMDIVDTIDEAKKVLDRLGECVVKLSKASEDCNSLETVGMNELAYWLVFTDTENKKEELLEELKKYNK